MNQIWTDAETDYILANAGRLKDFELAEQLTQLSGRPVTLAAVRQKRQRLRLKKRPGRGRCELHLFRPEVSGLALYLS